MTVSFAELEDATAQDVVAWTYRTHARVAVAASFQSESGVLIDMACRAADVVEVLTLDTGRLPEETHEVMETFRKRYRIELRVLTPDPEEVELMTMQHGTRLFLESVELRQRCCEVRKSRPLARALRGYDAWITGVRRSQTAQRAATPVADIDEKHHGIVKVAPLAAWSGDDVRAYLARHRVPRHPLYAQGYTSIGCAPCTRPTQAGEDERAGRWWWETDGIDGIKECGLHRAAPPAAVSVEACA